MNRTRAASTLLAILVLACGGDDPDGPVELARTYHVFGGARVLPDGITPTVMVPVRFTLRLDSAVNGTIEPLDLAPSTASAISGQYVAETGALTLNPFQATITATASESVEGFRGVLDDGTPGDDRADEGALSFRSERGRSVQEAELFAVSDLPGRLTAPQSGLTATVKTVGVVQLSAGPGTAPNNAPLELIVFSISDPPRLELNVARPDGSIDAEVSGLAGDLVGVRARSGALLGRAALVTVMR